MKAYNVLLLVILGACAQGPGNSSSHQDVIKTRNRQFTQCYQESDSHKSPGSVTMRARLRPNGIVRDADLTESSFQDANLHACLKGVLQTMKFPPGYADEVEFPLIFGSGNL